MKNLRILMAVTGILMITVLSFGASITGTIHYEGDAPKFKEIKMDADPICLSRHTEAVFPDILVLGEGSTMGNVFVHVKSGLAQKDYPIPEEPVVVDQNGCTYHPHVFGVRVGQPLKILNSDGTLHNVHVLPKINAEFNLAMPKFRKETTKIFDKAEFMFPIKCDVHPWMGAWMSVLEHPFFTTTKLDGVFTIGNLSAGTYQLEAWHEKLGTQVVDVTLAADETKEINFTFSRPEKK